MVGEPKTLFSLARMNAHLAVRCRACGASRVYHRGMLGSALMRRGANASWSQLPLALPCRCGSTNLALKPFACDEGQLRDPGMRPYHRALVRMAVEVLRRAADDARQADAPSIEVRLALHVLRPWTSRELLLAHAAVFRTEQSWRARAADAAVGAIMAELRMMGRLALNSKG